MNVLAVEVVGGDGVGDCVLCQALGVVLGDVDHVLGVDLNWLIMQFRFGDSLQPMRSLWQICVSLNPRIAIQMRDIATIILIPLITNPQLCRKVDIIRRTPSLNKRIVKPITIERRHYSRLIRLYKAGKSQ